MTDRRLSLRLFTHNSGTNADHILRDAMDRVYMLALDENFVQRVPIQNCI